MDELAFVYATGAVIVLYFLAQLVSRRFDPFAPVWLFLVGYVQVYVIQPFSTRQWAVDVHGSALVAEANWQAFWAILWFLGVYTFGPARRLARMAPGPPRSWSAGWILAVCPPLALWGAICSVRGIASAAEGPSTTNLLMSFPFWLLIAGILLIVTGRTIAGPRRAYFLPGLACSAAYVLIWMFNGKRSHSLMAVLSTMCALYLTRMRRPSWTVLMATAVSGMLVVGIAIGWRQDKTHERSLSGFVQFVADFRSSQILQCLNMADESDDVEYVSYETWEYGGYLLMLDTVPHKSSYDYGASYLRIFSTFIPRLIWHDKPIYGRDAWVEAWIHGSEFEREEDFTGPAIGILGATQLNGGVVGTLIVIGVVALLLRICYEYLRAYADVPWVQFWWAISYYNAWFMVVNDDPFIWFYYNWGFSTFPIVVLMWLVNRLSGAGVAAASPASASVARSASATSTAVAAC